MDAKNKYEQANGGLFVRVFCLLDLIQKINILRPNMYEER